MFLTLKLCTELFEIEQFICIKMDSTLNNLQVCHKTQTNKIVLSKIGLFIYRIMDMALKTDNGWCAIKPNVTYSW